MTDMHDEDPQTTDIPGAVAVIGMAGRWPGAESVTEFWKNLAAGVESVSRFTDAELEDSFGADVRAASNFVKARPILEDVGRFDAEFFGMYAREAELTDPQHRLFLECAWQALEDGGYDPAAYTGSIGVFAGASINTYFLNNVLGERRTVEGFVSNYQVGEYPKLLGAGADFLATRVSYKLDLRGPSFTMSTACSTSLLAVAQACQSLLLYQADMALAGGVSITFPQRRGYQHLEGGMVSADGVCRPFDADATGTIFGDGAGVVLLKRLEDAITDGDHVYAVVRGAGINNDGASKVGFTAPSVSGQAAVIEMAHANAGVEPRSISYVECHGTATPLGDPIEIAGLTQAFAAGTSDRNFCAVGSVKGNIGHLDAAAGITGFIKTVLALEHRMLPASLHYRRPNPQIDFSKTPFFVNAELTAWPETTSPRRAGVSAFGVGGTNVHVVLEEAPAAASHRAASAARGGTADRTHLVVLSARSAAALDASRQRLAAHLREHPDLPLPDVAFSLQVGRRGFDHRHVVVARDVAETIAKLEASAPRTPAAAARRTGSADVVFMFPGQGAQYPDMGRGLFDHEPVFRQAIERCAGILRPLLTEDLLGQLYPAEATTESRQRLMMTMAAQPAIFSVEYALASLWMSWGIKPTAMIGHSIGEFVAAVLSGVMSLEDALTVVAARGRLMQALPGGAMLAVRLAEADVLPLLTPQLSVAAINGPALCVVAGPFAAVDDLEQALTARNVVTRRLHTSHAFHSAMVEPVIEPLRQLLRNVKLSAPSIRYVSCVTGDWIQPEQATSADYWARHAREPVRFNDGILKASAPDTSLLIEVGPGNALSTLATQATRGRTVALQAVPIITSMQDAARERDDREYLLEAVGRAWIHGASPAWAALDPGPRSRVPLPTYPFERSRYFIAAPRSATPGVAAADVAAPHAGAAFVMEPLQLSIQDENAMTQSSANNRISEVSTAIAAIFEDLSGEKPASADAQTTFLEMGYDSLFLTQVAQKLQSQMKVKVTFRQLLGEFSTIPTLAKFLADKMPAPAAAAAPAPAAALPAAAGAAAAQVSRPVAPPFTAAAAPVAVFNGGPGIEGLFRDQLQAMSQLMNRQFEMLQGLGGVAAPPAGSTLLPAAAPTTAAPVPAVPVQPVPRTAAEAASAAAVAAEAPAESSRFAVFMQGKGKSTDHAMTAEQRRHIDALIERYTRKTAGSKAFTQAHRAVLADPRAAAGFRAEWKEMVYPIVNTTSAGSKIYDLDGNEYIDILNGFGQTAFGHAPPFVTAAVKAQLDRGFAIGPQADMAGKVAQLFCEITGNDRMTFCNTGSEAVMAAMRLARTVTGREKIVIFNGDYHGQFDEVLVKGVQKSGAEPRSQPVAPGIPGTQVANMIVLEYGTPASLQWIRDNAEDLAAVIVEPVQSRHPHTRPFEFLREIRRITEASGTAFVMDEVVTGFRVHPGGMQAVLDIRADMATYGKVVGGGMPIGVLAGNTRFMDALDGGQWSFGDASIPEVGVTFFAGTFVRHPLVLAAMWAVLNHIKDSGPSMQETLAKKTAKLVGRLTDLFESHGVKTKIESYSSWFFFNFNNEHPLASLFYYHMRDRGIHIQESFPCFLTTAHSDSDFEKIYRAFEESLESMQSVGILGTGRTASTAVAAAAPAPATAAAGAMSPGDVPLTESQLEIWLSAQLGDDASCAFNESVSLRMQGRLNQDALQKSLDRIVARHDALRATFTSTGEAMRITAAKPFDYPHTDLSNRSPPDAEIAFAEVLDADARKPFDLVNGPCVRGNLVTLSKESHAFVLTAHHIICDGWSINVIVNELAELYAAACRGEALELPPALPFSEYARAQAARDPADLARTESYWLKEFAQPPATLELPTDRPRPTVKSFNGSSLCRRIDATLYQAVKKAGARQGSTLFVTLLAACQALMGRFAGQSEVVVGVPTAGQSLLEDQVLVGHCVNFLPIRGAWTQHTKVAEYLAATTKRVLDAYEHQSYTFGTLVRQLNLPREPGRLPLAEIQFNLERLADRIQLPDMTMDVAPNAKAFVNFDLFLNVIESADGLRMDCDYNTDLFDAATVAHWLDCYQALLESIVADAGQPLATVSCVPAAERVQLLERINATACAYPRDRSVHALFEAQAAQNPDAIAAQFAEVSVTYAVLDRRANQMANALRERISGPHKTGKLIGVSVERSLDMLVALLAVLKAGCAYVPLDPMHPAARLRYILDEAEVAALISDGSENAALVPEGTPVLDVRRDAALIAGASVAAPAQAASADSLAYVIYTSGSTGKPKGVEISHRAVVNLLTSMARTPGLTAKDVFYAVTTISFDIAGLELFLPLIVGGKVVIAERDAVIDGFRLLKNLETVGATAMQATPASWRLLLEAGFKAPPAFKMLCGGEALPRDLANRLLQGSGELWNMYGPTETTIWSSCTRITAGAAPITVGGPIANTQFYILDRNDQPLPTGIPGQLHIGGDGVARGYYKREALTAEKFVPNPFTGGRIYRTGDLARWLPDGTLQVMGRIDHQVKLRGFRIELGEIEAVLTTRGNLSAAAVILREDVPGTARLVAYYVQKPDTSRTPEALRALLAEEMPEYMIPSAWMPLEALPLSPNGKLDRAALPLPDAALTAKEEFVEPTTPTEVALTKIFAEVLNLQRVGATSDLLKMGADSIQLFQITARANRAGIKITARQLLQHRNAAALGAIADLGGEASTVVEANSSLPSLAQFKRSRRTG